MANAGQPEDGLDNDGSPEIEDKGASPDGRLGFVEVAVLVLGFLRQDHIVRRTGQLGQQRGKGMFGLDWVPPPADLIQHAAEIAGDSLRDGLSRVRLIIAEGGTRVDLETIGLLVRRQF